MNWKERIVENPEIMVGKPTVKGTRIPVELVLKFLANDLEMREIFRAYPRLTREDVKACILFSTSLVESRGKRLARKRLRELESSRLPHPTE